MGLSKTPIKVLITVLIKSPEPPSKALKPEAVKGDGQLGAGDLP